MPLELTIGISVVSGLAVIVSGLLTYNIYDRKQTHIEKMAELRIAETKEHNQLIERQDKRLESR